MPTKPTGKRIVDSKEEGVTFIFPPELDYVFVHRLEVPDIKNIEGNPGQVFVPQRVFAKFKLYKRTSITTIEVIESFEASFEIVIHYKHADVINAHGRGKEMACAYYDEPKQEWVRFGKVHGFNPKKYNLIRCKERKSGFKGFGVVKINNWPDPAMAWGP